MPVTNSNHFKSDVMNIKILRIIACLLILVVGFSACRKDEIDLPEPSGIQTKDFNNKVALEWMDFFLEIERFTPGYRPPASARNAAYIGLAGYEAAQPGMANEYNSFSGYYFGLTLPKIEQGATYHWPTCVHAAYATSFNRFFPTAPAAQLQKMFTLTQKFYNQFSAEVPQDVFNRSKAFGEAVANVIFEWSKTDTYGHEAYLKNHDPNYVPPSGPGRWQPTYPDYTPALLPHWGKVRTFAANQDDTVPTPIPYSTDQSSQLYVQAKEVMVIVNNIKEGKNATDRWIADFWSDDCPILTFTPAGRWIAITNQVVASRNVSLDVAVYAYAKVNMAICDAGIRCWNEKYKYNLQRPIDYIREVMPGQQNWNTMMCPDGSGAYFTPPFPAYPSGHATFGGAAAEVLTDVFGFNYSMIDRCHEGRTEFIGTPRQFRNFYEMAEENGYSRIPIGVHFRMDAEAGVDLGYRIGRKVNNLPWKK